MALTITPQIVNMTVQVTSAPTPSSLQQSGAIISVGGTTLTTGSYQFIGSVAALDLILSTAGNYAELTNMAKTFFDQGSAVGLYVLELGANTNVVDQVNALNTWITDNPGVFYSYLDPADWDTLPIEVGSVIITNGGSGYTTAPTVTFSAASGGGVTATGTATINGSGVVTAVTITNPGYYPNQTAPTVTFSAPTSGTTATGTVNVVNDLIVMGGNLSSPSAKTYFFQMTTPANASNYNSNKAFYVKTPAPTAPSTEFTVAADFYDWLVNNPSQATPLTPMAYRNQYGVTPWVQYNNSAAINETLTAYGNLVLTGAEGGLTNSINFKGTLSDGSQSAWWYGIDWLNIQIHQALAAAIINGSNSNPPLLYDQAGINSLQAVAQGIANAGISFGCALSATVTATPFYTYSQDNPGDYKAGIYNGFSMTVVGVNGFLTITFAIDAIQFA